MLLMPLIHQLTVAVIMVLISTTAHLVLVNAADTFNIFTDSGRDNESSVILRSTTVHFALYTGINYIRHMVLH